MVRFGPYKWQLSRLEFIAICLLIVDIIAVPFFSLGIVRQMIDLMNLRSEYASLPEPDEIGLSAFDTEMRGINPDYICWITIGGTEVDYPVVRGADNEKYLHTSFYGEENVYGALFMDYRCVGDDVPHIIIYGHNSRHGDMFGGLRHFLDALYLAQHPVIILVVNERVVEYEIFSARKTDITDPAYFLDFSAPGSFRAFAERNGAPPDAAQILTLSTCVSGDNKDEMVVIKAALR